MLTKRIANVEFSVLSPDMIRKMSAIEIKTAETYDKDGYPMEGGLMDPHLGVINPGLRCKTCGNPMKTCPGHFGHMNLVRPVVHSEFSKKVEDLMTATCQKCGRIAIKEEKLEDMRNQQKENPKLNFERKILLKTKKVKKCPHCAESRKTVLLDKPTNFYMNKERIYPTQIREWMEKIPEKDIALFSYQPKRIRPEWFVLTTLQAPPINIRPSITLESGMKSEDDLTHKLVDIIRINQRLKDNIDAGAPQLIIEDLWDLLQYHVTTYFDNNTAGVPPAKHRSGRALRTIVQRLKGKKGRFRFNLTGKRVNFAARSTITPDPYISINEIGVPRAVANELTVPEFITEWNEKRYKKEIKDGTSEIQYVIRPNGQRKRVTDETRAEIAEELTVGYRVERKLQNGDVVLFNRQPSLHRVSMMAHYARIMDNKTFRINPSTAKPYNADFDGDEMNLHVPQTEEGKTEAKNLMLCSKQLISPRHGGPVIVMDEDQVSGSFLLSLKSTVLTREQAMQYLYEVGITQLPEPDVDGKHYSGKLIISQVLPKDLNLDYNTYTHKMVKKAGLLNAEGKVGEEYDAHLKIENGRMVEGVIDASSLGEGSGELVDTLFREYGHEEVDRFYNVICRWSGRILTSKGMTAGLDEYHTTDADKKVIRESISEELEESEKLVKQLQNKTLEHIPGKNLEESFEIRMLQLGARVKDKVEKEILRQKITETLVSENPKYNTTVMILSKARGKPVNLTNMEGIYGQASVREGRPRKGFRDRLISANKPGDLGAIAGGFITSNFSYGFRPIEFFIHSMGGRQGEVDTSVATKVSGYLYRRLANNLKDLWVHNDETVRTANNNLIQFTYGEDAVFPMNALRGKNVNVGRVHARMKAKGDA